jgi:2-keto-4-pentenoate hydratase/2-oxohepta-3-ene-1,7-dioic acid hydratase in catechol pathway
MARARAKKSGHSTGRGLGGKSRATIFFRRAQAAAAKGNKPKTRRAPYEPDPHEVAAWRLAAVTGPGLLGPPAWQALDAGVSILLRQRRAIPLAHPGPVSSRRDAGYHRVLSIVRFARLVTASGESWSRLDGANAELLDAPPWDGGRPTGNTVTLSGTRFLCPVLPRKIFGIGKNYRAHASEMGGAVPAEPLVFAKATSSLLASEGTVLLPGESTRVDYEGELGVVIGSRCRRVAASNALGHVFGYTVVCDITARDLQSKDGQWTRAKSFDTFCPVGPLVVTGVDPGALDLRLTVNGVVRQDGNTRDMVFGVAELVAYVSSFGTLEPGDLIATGTPEGVGSLSPGDAVEVTIEEVGTLRFRVAREE